MKKLIFTIFLILAVSKTFAQYPPPPPLNGTEKYTTLFSVSYDYQSNGSIRYIVQDPNNPNNLCCILMAQHDSTTGVGTGRYIYSAYSTNSGNTWDTIVVAADRNYGFPNMSVRNGVPVIAMHNTSTTGTFVFRDVIWGGLSWGIISGFPTSPTTIIWPHLTSSTNNNLIVVGSESPGFFGYYTVYNGTNWTPLMPLPNSGGTSGQYTIESGTGGLVSVFGVDYNGNESQIWYKSTNNGANFVQDNSIPPYILDGTDTLVAYTECGRQAVYSGSEPHLVFGVYGTQSFIVGTNRNAYIKPRIYHWSPSTGLTLVASRVNIPALTDTITHALVTPLCQPSIGRLSNGTLICTYTTFLRGNTQIVDDGTAVNAGEIFYCFSVNNGLSWSTPSNITFTPNLEEKHSSLVRQMASTSGAVFYIRDMKAGGWVNIASWGKAPVYGILNPSILPHGIQNISQTATKFNLGQNYPNPFNPSTKFKFDLPPVRTGRDLSVKLIIYNSLGQEVTVLVHEQLKSGQYEVDWDASNYPSGVYYYKLISGIYSETKKMILMK